MLARYTKFLSLAVLVVAPVGAICLSQWVEAQTYCYSTIAGVTVPVVGTFTWGGGVYTYTCNWSCNFDCSDATIPTCYNCYATNCYSSTNNGKTYTKIPGASYSPTTRACNSGYNDKLIATLAPLTPGVLYEIEYLANPFTPSTACGDGGFYNLYYTQSFTCPLPP